MMAETIAPLFNELASRSSSACCSYMIVISLATALTLGKHIDNTKG